MGFLFGSVKVQGQALKPKLYRCTVCASFVGLRISPCAQTFPCLRTKEYTLDHIRDPLIVHGNIP